MKLDTIGKNIRKFRLARKLRQEDLAEKTDLTTNYIGMVERGEKIPSLETFIKIVNALGVSSDMECTYFVIIDKLQRAKQVDPSVAEEANKLIGRYSAHTPQAKDLFMLGYKAGDRITIGGWIGESTTIR